MSHSSISTAKQFIQQNPQSTSAKDLLRQPTTLQERLKNPTGALTPANLHTQPVPQYSSVSKNGYEKTTDYPNGIQEKKLPGIVQYTDTRR